MTRENRAAGRKTCVWNRDIYTSTIVITGLVSVIHVVLSWPEIKSWMAGS